MLEDCTDEDVETLAALEADLADFPDTTSDAHRTSCFDGDIGTLDFEARKVLVRLLEGPFLSRADNSAAWDVFLKHRREITQRMNELFLVVEVNMDLEVAYRVNAQPEGTQPFPSLMRRATWSLYEAIVLLVLRRRFETDSLLAMDGEPVSMLREDIEAAALERLPAGEADVANAQKYIGKAIDELKSRHILHLTGDTEYRIDPMIAILLGADQAKLLEPWLNAYGPTGAADEQEEER